jgi:hypothetical protein
VLTQLTLKKERQNMPEHRIEIARAKVDSYVASYNGERMGEYREPLCAGARWLLSHGHAAPDDTIVMCAKSLAITTP